jgi:hypothetical protein
MRCGDAGGRTHVQARESRSASRDKRQYPEGPGARAADGSASAPEPSPLGRRPSSPRPSSILRRRHAITPHFASSTPSSGPHQGRLAPEGQEYVSSWVSTDLTTCWQVMACDDPALLDEWMAQLADLVDFEVQPVLTSHAAAEKVGRSPTD